MVFERPFIAGLLYFLQQMSAIFSCSLMSNLLLQLLLTECFMLVGN